MADPTTAPPIVTPWYLDKGLWVMVLTPLCAVLAKKFGLALDAAEIAGIALPVVAYVVMHKWKTATLQSAQIAADAASAEVKTVADAAKVLGPVP